MFLWPRHANPPSSPWSKGRTADVLSILNLEKTSIVCLNFYLSTFMWSPFPELSSAVESLRDWGLHRKKCLWRWADNIILVLWHWIIFLLAASGLVRSWDQPQEPSFLPGSGVALRPGNGPAKEKWDSGAAKGKSASASNKHPGPQCAPIFILW